MKRINQQNVIPFLTSYFASIGLEKDANVFFATNAFSDCLIIRLPAVCLVQANKPFGSNSKQSHIHITGDNRYFLYSKEEVDNISVSTRDAARTVVLSAANIENLNNRSKKQFSGIGLVKSYTHTKIATRQNQDSQVQISKIRMDGDQFVKLRNGLYLDDLLVMLKYKGAGIDGKPEFFTVGIPSEFYEGKYVIDTQSFSHVGSRNVPARAAIMDLSESVSTDDVITDEDEIADIVYQQMVDLVDDDELVQPADYRPVAYDGNDTGRLVNNKRPQTNPNKGKAAIKRSNYCCSFATDSDPHETFIKKNGKKYMEVHHLIPIRFQSKFANKLDTDANLVCVCPLCHRKLHHGNEKDVNDMLSFLYNDRKDVLKASGLSITLNELIGFYQE